MQAQMQKEHEWLNQLVGDWTFESECSMGPGQPPSTFKGSETVRSLGGVWILCEGQGEMPGGGVGKTIMTLGYDPAKKRFVGTFIGSMMTHLWVYSGALDAAGKVLTLDTEGPSFSTEEPCGAPGAKLATYKDVIELKSPDLRILSSHLLGEDGKWTGFMSATYRRKK